MYKLKILDSKSLDGRTWMLCKGNLNDYLTELKDNFYNFSIQRKIVKNQYLDTLLTTVKQGDPIPVITLTYKDANINVGIGSEIFIDMNQVEILDGLQRTFRLWSYKTLVRECQNITSQEIVPFTKALKEKHPTIFDAGVLSLNKIKNVFSEGGISSIEQAYTTFDVYFAIWINLTPKQIIHKMLLLNAGQRSVSKTHQFELLFLYLWEDLQKNTNIKLFREKDKEANIIKSGNRNPGEYVFSSIIVGLRSFLEKKPLRVTIDDLDFDDLQNDSSNEDVNEDIFTTSFLSKFLFNIKEVDQVVSSIEPEEGKKWFVRDTTLSGLLAALGELSNIQTGMPVSEIEELMDKSFRTLKDKLKGNVLNLKEFIEEYNILSSRSVNIGYFIRRVVMHFIARLLLGENPTWKNSFNSNLKKELL